MYCPLNYLSHLFLIKLFILSLMFYLKTIWPVKIQGVQAESSIYFAATCSPSALNLEAIYINPRD